jgi:TonB family protein
MSARPAPALFLLLAALLAFPALAQSEDAPDAGAPQGVLTKAPTIAKQVQAEYPPDAAKARLSATVGLLVTIGADGSVTEVTVSQPAGHGFDEAAVKALQQFQFTPAEIDGKPSPVQIQYSYRFVAPEPPKEPPLNFTGEVIARDTGKPLEGASVVVQTQPNLLSTLTDANGRFALRGVPTGTFGVRVKAAGYDRYEVQETFKQDVQTQVRYFVRKSVTSPLEVVVRGKRERREVTEVALQREEILRVPGSNGDAFRVLQNLPGVARAPFGLGALIVRGGSAWDTRVYVDGVQVPQLFHFGGLYATFNSDLLESLDFQPGSFGVGYGRSVGGLVKAETRTPGQKPGGHGHVDINIVDASVLYEHPLGKDWSIVVAGRRSYLDFWLPAVIPQDQLKLTVAPRYYDYQLRLERNVGDARTWFELFGSNDRLALAVANPAGDPEGRSSFGTYSFYNRLTFHDERPLAGWRNRLDAAVGFDQTSFNAGQDLFFDVDSYPLTLRETISRRFGKYALAFGADVFSLPYKLGAQLPSGFRPGAIPDPLLSRSLAQLDLRDVPVEPAIFGELRLYPTEALELVAGVRADWDTQLEKGWVDPRLAAFWAVTPRVKLKAAAGLYHQPPNYQRGLLTPEFGNPDLLPEAASQYSVGLEAAITQTLKLNVDLYDEELFHLAVATRAPPPGQPPPPRYLSTGRGRSYGMEILLRKDFTEHFFGWVSYSLSRAERTANGETGLSQSRYDQPQHLVALASWKFSHGWTLGGRIQYLSGPLDTPYAGAIYDANAGRYQPIPGDPFSVRLPPYFQFDVRVDKQWRFQDWALTVYADVQNVTNRQNVEDVSYNYDYTQRGYVSGLPILPVLGVRADF